MAEQPTGWARHPRPQATAPRPAESDHRLLADLGDRLCSVGDLAGFLDRTALDGMWIWDLGSPEHVWLSDRFREMLGFADSRMDGAALLHDAVHPGDSVVAEEAFRKHLADPEVPYDQILRYRHRDGSLVWVRSRGFVLRDPDGVPTRFVGVQTDLTDGMRTQEELADTLRSLEEYTEMLQRLDEVSVALQRIGEPDEVLASLVRVLGSELGDLCVLFEVDPVSGALTAAAAESADPYRYEVLAELLAGNMLAEDQGPLGEALRSGSEVFVPHVDGPSLLARVPEAARPLIATQLPISLMCLPWEPTDQQTDRVVLVARYDANRSVFGDSDLTLARHIVERHRSGYERTSAQREHRAVEHFRHLARSAPMAILHVDSQLGCTFANHEWCRITGRDDDETLGRRWIEVFPPEELERLTSMWQQVREAPPGEDGAPSHLRVEARILGRAGELIWIGGNAVAQFDRTGGYTGYLIAFSDITAGKQAEEALNRRARQDALTGTANRFALFEAVDAGLRNAHAGSETIGLLYVDLDTFKEVNDSFGHEVGDLLLVELARRFGGVVRGSDLCARVGGDEFVLLLRELPEPFEAVRVAQRVHESLRERFSIAGATVNMSASIGIVTIGGGDGIVRSDEFLRRADRAMYRAKEAGRNRWAVYDGSVDDSARSEAVIRDEIDAALRDDRLVLHHQPIVELSSRKVVGVEALIRIRQESGALLPPGDFLDVAERSGQILRIGRFVVHDACRQLGEWQRDHPDLYMSLNLSGRQANEPGTADLILDALAAHGVSPTRLVVEVTETTIVNLNDAAADGLRRIQAAGVRIAIDDFGTGWSSLERLTMLPADVLKIDRTFVDGAAEDPVRSAVISAVVHLADRLGLAVVAEGIETPEQANTVLGLGCGVGQGYLFSRPVPAEEVEGLLGALL